MNKKYNQIMNHIEVTVEMQTRIVKNLKKLHLKQSTVKRNFFLFYKKPLYITACLLLVLTSVITIKNIINQPNEVLVAPNIHTYLSMQELSDSLGFKVEGIKNLPFEVESIKYTALWGETAEVEYRGLDNRIIFRMALGNEDISGYHAAFTSIEEHVINGENITIKGDGTAYQLGVWTKDKHTYSVQFIKPVEKQMLLDTIQASIP